MTTSEFKEIFFDRPSPKNLYREWKDSDIRSFADFWERWTARRISEVTGAEIVPREEVEKRPGDAASDIVWRYSGGPYVLREPLGSQKAPDNLYVNGHHTLQIENKSSTGNTATMNSAIIDPSLLYFFFRRPKNQNKIHLSFFRVFYGGDFWEDRKEEYEKVQSRVEEVKEEARDLLRRVYPESYKSGFTSCYPRMKHRDPKMNDSRFEELENMLAERVK